MEDFVSLANMNLAANEIEDIKWFSEESNLPNLYKLNMRGNKIRKWFVGAEFEVLKDLNLSDNRLETF